MSRRILLFGKQGQLSYRLLERLSDAHYDVTALGSSECDFTRASAKEIATILRAVDPQLVINAAAYTAVDAAEADATTAHRVNAEMPALLAHAAREQHVPLLHFSTDYVFDGERGTPYREEDETRPLGVYAKSKLAGEQAVRAEGGTVFRLQWVYDTRGRNFFLTMQRLLAEREEVRVVADQLGAPSYAPHLAAAITQAVPDLMTETLPPGIYHLAAGGFTSWHGFACAIAAARGHTARVVPITTAEYPLPAPRPKDGRLDTSLLADYGIAMPHWRAGLRDAVARQC